MHMLMVAIRSEDRLKSFSFLEVHLFSQFQVVEVIELALSRIVIGTLLEILSSIWLILYSCTTIFKFIVHCNNKRCFVNF